MSDSDTDDLTTFTDSGTDEVSDETGEDSVTEAGPDWFGRIRNAIIGVVFGLILLPGSVVLLSWNEHRAVETERSLAEGMRVMQEAAAGQVDSATQGKLVHVSGPLSVQVTLADPDFPVRAPNAAVLRRSVETYQWQETQHSNHDNSTTYSYSRVWSENIKDSSRFHQQRGHSNRPPRFTGLKVVAPKGALGARTVSDSLLTKLDGGSPLRMTEAPRPGMSLDGDAVYVGADPATPQIGDQRISWTMLRPADVSVIARQEGNGFTPYQTNAGDGLYMISSGVVPAAAMIHQAEEMNAVFTWVLRAIGAIMMLAGFCLLLWPLAALGSLLPFVGEVIGDGIFVLGVLLTLIVAPLVIAIAWVVVRPLVGSLVLLIGIAAGFGLLRVVRARRAVRALGRPAFQWGP
jgi:hypothetical protein